MAGVLQDIWILSDAGTVVFHRVYDEKMDTQLFGALMSALNSFAEEIAQGGLSNFDLSDMHFTIMKKNDFLFVANSSKKTKAKKVEEELQVIVDKFFKTYPKEVLENWEGEVDVFTNFEEKIESSLKETIKKFEKAFW